MKPLSQIAEAVQASTTLAIDAMFKKMKADGIDVVGFGAGEPDFHTPDNIKQAGIDAINSNFTYYTPSAGTLELRQAICDRLKADCGLSYTPSQIVAASGAKHNVFIALMTLINPGDEVILPAPYWVSYYELIKMVGGVPVILDTTEESGFKITAGQLKAAVTPKTKVFILNNPSNPTGMMYSRGELEQLADICVENQIYVIADEIYYKLVYGGAEFVSFASLGEKVKELTILINGVSKTYSMTGWRLGYAAANSKIAGVMANYVSHSTSGPSSISQKAAVEALVGTQDSVELMRKAFEERRNYFLERAKGIKGITCVEPQGAFYIMMNISELIGKKLYGTEIKGADDFASLFLEKGLVALVPCTGFGTPEYVRWSYATSIENIKEGLTRLERFLANG